MGANTHAAFRTEIDFELPKGYLDEGGTLHRRGVMRLATAADEILPLRDPRVVKNPAYLVILLLSRVVVRLGGVDPITPKTIEDLFATDLAFLQDLYNKVNDPESGRAEVTCPHCRGSFVPEAGPAGG